MRNLGSHVIDCIESSSLTTPNLRHSEIYVIQSEAKNLRK